MDFSKILINWYLNNKRNLPWRKNTDPYRIWLSEIMLQQTRIEQGLPYYNNFIDAFPTVFELAEAPQDRVLKLWQGLGYYSRARNLHETARFVAAELKGEFPMSYKSLLKLKGVGEYTASAIASISYNEPVAVVDGNVYRVLARYFNIETPTNSTAGIKEFRALAQELLESKAPGDYNQAIMEFGALQCKPKNPLCDSCPLSNSCLALKENRVKELPVKLKKGKVKKRYFNYLVFHSKDNKTLLQQRKGKGIWEGLYEFPLVETSTLIDAEAFLSEDKLKEVLSGARVNLELYNKAPVVHKLSHQHIYTRFWLVKIDELDEKGVGLHRVKEYPVPVLIQNFLNEHELAAY